MPKKENKGVNKNTVLAREYTINLHKRTHGLYVPLSLIFEAELSIKWPQLCRYPDGIIF